MPGEHKFPRREHLTHTREFQHAYAEGGKWVGGAFVCYAIRQPGQGRKLGCTVSRKVGGAVARNRVKRYLREVYRVHRCKLPDDVHFVFIARPAAAALNYHECAAAIRQLLEKGDMLDG